MLLFFKKRFVFWWISIRATWGFPVLIIGTLWGIFSFWREDIFKGAQDNFRLIALLPQWALSTWGIMGLTAIIVVLLEAGYRTGGRLQEQLDGLNTPNLSVEFLELRSKYGIAELSITIKNLSHMPIRAETWCTGYTVTKKDEEESVHTEFEVAHFVAKQFTLTSEESHNPVVLQLYEKDLFGPIKVIVPNKRQYDLERLYGDEFTVTFTVFGGLKPVCISFRCAIKDGKLWVETIEEQTTATS